MGSRGIAEKPRNTEWEPSGGGEMGERIRAFDWAATSLGPMKTWPHSLRTTVDLMLAMPQPACICWGPDLCLLYNDDYTTILEIKHPALARPLVEVWPELARSLQPMIDGILAAEPRRFTDREFAMTARDRTASTRRFSGTWTPLYGDGSTVVGFFCTTGETTERLLVMRALVESEARLRAFTDIYNERTAREDLEARDAARTGQLFAAVDEVRRNEQRLRLLLEQMPAMLWTTDREMRVTALAGASSHVWPIGQGLVDDSKIADLFAGTDMDGMAQTLHQRVLQETPTEFEFRVDNHTYKAHIEPLRDAEGCTIGTIGMAHDVTDRTLRKLHEDVISSISHELQTPLTAIRAGLGLLDTAVGRTLEPPERELLTASRRNAERLRLQIERLLTANRLLAGQTEAVEHATVDLRQVANDAIAAIQPLVQEKEQVVEVDMPVVMHVEGDARLLYGVLANLLSNAHRHTPPATRITVSGWMVAGEVWIAVHDSGPGIPAEELEAIFQRFYRVPGLQREGVGLGLAIARDAVEAHAGRIWAESQPGRGTTFFVVLPHAIRRAEP